MASNTLSTKQLSPEGLEIKYQPTVNAENLNSIRMIVIKSNPPKKFKKSKVKQMASKFNSKIAHLIKGNTAVRKYKTLVNELLPEPPQEFCIDYLVMGRAHLTNLKTAMPAPETSLKTLRDGQNVLKCNTDGDTYETLVNELLPEPPKEYLPMPRTRLVKRKAPIPTPRTSLKKSKDGQDVLEGNTSIGTKAAVVKYSPVPRTRLVKRKAPIPTPRASSKIPNDGQDVPEHVFGKLSVKQKAQWYKQFVDEMIKRNPNFHLSPTNCKSFVNETEEVKKQAFVKDLLDELEFNSVFPKPTAPSATTIQRMESMKKACAARKNAHAKEFGDVFQKKSTKDNNSLFRKEDNKQKQYTNSFIQHQELFFCWFKEKQENASECQSKTDEDKQNCIIEHEQPNEIPTPVPRNQTTNNCNKTAEAEESESGISSFNKITSEESQPENYEIQTKKCENDFDFPKPMRKKKLRKNASECNKEAAQIQQQITSTDSETDGEHKPKNSKLLMQIPAKENMPMPTAIANETEAVMLEDLIKSVNSPRKIRSAYTLTFDNLDTDSRTPRPSLNIVKAVQTNTISSMVAEELSFSDNFTDQGFETATDSPLKTAAENSQPPSSTSASITGNYTKDTGSSKFQEFVTALDTSLLQNTSIQKNTKVTDVSSRLYKKNFNFSTPIKIQERHSFDATSSGNRLFSPIAKPPKSRRKSLYDVKRRSSLAMHVITEDQPLAIPPTRSTSNICSETAQKFFANATTIENTIATTTTLPAEKTSQFWLKSGDFSLSLDINYIEPLSVRLLYGIFSRSNCDSKDLHFGIDDNKFSVHGPLDINSNSNRTHSGKDCSHYWFSNSELTIPFSGRYLLPSKIQRLFRFIKETIAETSIFSFGVDDVEFSNVPEFWNECPKFSIDSRYSMLVGLQTGDSNGLEGRSKYAWPHTNSVMAAADKSNNNADNAADDCESYRLLYSPFGSNYFDLSSLGNNELDMPRNSIAMLDLEVFCDKYENQPLDQLFEKNKTQQPEQQQQQQQYNSKNNDAQPNKSHIENTLAVPKMISTVENEEQRSSMQQQKQQHDDTIQTSFVAKNALDACKDTPEYIKKLKGIVADIGHIGCSKTFSTCSIDELDSYTYFLDRYAEIYLTSCKYHKNTILDALTDYKIK